ncbi:aromatic prenyltransferase Orf2 [Nocardia tenerifensis]|uniref:Aromatic prenyltransferase Orf2 n=1 Tax=Nocardia tenerifensis TaxID=228006 RepID=A0A318KBE7_9NOCA|nr:aromatic prenyltransferase [Nocardia tenerifensis]PXX71207.1 aromatic prenyltransferase Orf2 [Nocardia tenerifensis]
MSASGVTAEILRRDLREFARLAESRYDPGVVDAVLAALDGVWGDSWLAVRTTTHPPPARQVSVRFMNLPASADPVGRLRAAGLLDFAGHPMEQLVSADVPVDWGVDVAIDRGVQKIWLVFQDLIEVDRILGFPGMPASARAHAEQLRRWSDGEFALLALDFLNRTMNLYAQILPPGRLGAADIADILRELDFVAADEDELAALGRPYTVYATFAWNSPRVQRICFPARYTAETFPAIDPVLSRFVDGAPCAGPGPHGFAFYAAYGASGRYYKVQADYTSPLSHALPGGADLPGGIDLSQNR